MSNGQNDEAKKAEAKKAKLAKLLAEFSADELGEVLSEELDATTRRKIKGTAAADPEKVAIHGKLSAQIDKADTAKLAEWVEGKDSRSCSLNGPSPVGMDDGLGGEFDKMSIIFRFSSEAIRKANLDARNAAAEANGE